MESQQAVSSKIGALYRRRGRARPDRVAMLVNDKEQARLFSICSAGCHILAKWAEHDLSDRNAAGSAANSSIHMMKCNCRILVLMFCMQ